MAQDFEVIATAVSAIRNAIIRSRYRSLVHINREILSLFYAVGGYISDNSRSGYWGKGILEAISTGLQHELPGIRGFSPTALKDMRTFHEQWSKAVERTARPKCQPIDEAWMLNAIRQPSADELDWNSFVALPFSSHVEILRKTSSEAERWFYIRQAVANSWSKYRLREFLKAGTYEKAGQLPNNFPQTVPDSSLALKASKMFKEEYYLDFINVEPLGEAYQDIDERVIEREIVVNIQKFIMAMGDDFSFIGSQYRILVEGEEMFVDLLFFNRELNCLVAVELKTGKFKTSYLGQLCGYLSALDAFVKKPHENPSIGIVLCRDMNNAFVEFAIRDYDKPMGVARYSANAELPERYAKALPDRKELLRLLSNPPINNNEA